MALIVKLDNTTIKNPTKPVAIGKYPVTAHVGRVASGLMTMSFVAEKSTFQFVYDVIRYDVLQVILDIIEDFPTLFHTLSITENGVAVEYTVYAGAVTKIPFRTDNDGYWVYKDVSWQLIER